MAKTWKNPFPAQIQSLTELWDTSRTPPQGKSGFFNTDVGGKGHGREGGVPNINVKDCLCAVCALLTSF